ncbi:MAG: hypothetical protein ACRDI2_10400 [Chloroflexota bacterium]
MISSALHAPAILRGRLAVGSADAGPVARRLPLDPQGSLGSDGGDHAPA